jgi:hypothetical protein
MVTPYGTNIMLYITITRGWWQMYFRAYSQAYSHVYSWMDSITYSQLTWLYPPRYVHKILPSAPPSTLPSLKYTKYCYIVSSFMFFSDIAVTSVPKYPVTYTLIYPQKLSPIVVNFMLLINHTRYSQVHLEVPSTFIIALSKDNVWDVLNYTPKSTDM